jgi:hypothetical protein
VSGEHEGDVHSFPDMKNYQKRRGRQDCCYRRKREVCGLGELRAIFVLSARNAVRNGSTNS